MKTKNTITLIVIFILIISYQNCSQLVDSEHASNSLEASQSLVDLEALETKAMSVISAKCLNCHTADSTNPLQEITNKEKMIAEGYLVVNEPQNSPLFIDIIDGQMPPNNPLTEEETAIIKNWILGEKSVSDSLSDILAPPTDGPETQPATFAEVQTLVRARCSACHLNGNNRGGITLNTYAEVMRYVTPNNTVASSLYGEVQRNEMPPANPLSPTEKQVIYSWINDGARNN